MKRREFIKKTGLATAGAIALPYILPTGRLFAATGTRKANHVVFCLFAGGVRSIESVQKAEGNLMTNMLAGSEAISSDIAGGMDPLPAATWSTPLQNYGTLFKQFKYGDGPTGHFNGHTCAMTGVYTTTDLNIKDHPQTPTIFEFYRKHNSPSRSAMNAWWISNTLGPYPALNFSNFAGYGAQYGANFIAPTALMTPQEYDVIGNPRNFSSKEQSVISNMRGFMDNNFNKTYVDGDAGVSNTGDDFIALQNYINSSFQSLHNGDYNNIYGAGSALNNDMKNIFFAEDIIKRFAPELVVVNMQDVDICHTDFTSYCNNLRKADYAVGHLWNTIQNTPGMANDTILIVAPEHGRNLAHNTNIDRFGRAALDHTASVDGSGDQTARDIFCLIAGPPGVVQQATVIDSAAGESIEIVPTIANILGFEDQMPAGILKKRFADCDIKQAFK